MSILAPVLIIGQFVLVAAFLAGLALLIWALAYDALDNRRRAAAQAHKVRELEPVTGSSPAPESIAS